ncbi:MAG: hypothetical protein WCS42_25575 [Verrucomicrobiota bacterium]
MRIALCLEYAIDQHGGTEVLVSELVRGLAPQHEIILVSSDNPASFTRSKIAPFIARHISISPEWTSAAPAR